MPLTAGPSSSPVTRKLIEPANGRLAMKRKAAAAAAARPPFMSQAPRPQSWPSATSAENGSNRQRVEVAGRDDVGVAGEGEIGLSPPEPRIEVQDVGRSRRREDDELGGESRLGHEIAQIRQRAAVGRRHRPTADERARDLERGGRLRACGHQASGE